MRHSVTNSRIKRAERRDKWGAQATWYWWERYCRFWVSVGSDIGEVRGIAEAAATLAKAKQNPVYFSHLREGREG